MGITLFALHTTREWAEEVVSHLNIPISEHEEINFMDGEHKSRPLENVRNRDVFVLQSLFEDDDQSVNDKLCRLLFFIGALKDASARQITAVLPYFAYARKDRKNKARDPVTMKYMAQLFEAAGADRILTMDIHNLAAFQNAFRIPTENLEARVIFAPYFAEHFKDEEIVIVSPDVGGIKRAEQFQETLSRLMHKKISIAFLEKKRSDEKVEGGIYLVGEVTNKLVIIVDDILDTGSTIALALNAISNQGARRIFACVTHGIFTGKANEIVSDPRLEKLFITDNIPPFRLNQKSLAKTEILNSGLLFSQAIARMQTGDSVSTLLEL